MAYNLNPESLPAVRGKLGPPSDVYKRQVPADAAGQPEDDEVDTEEPLDTGMIGSSPSMLSLIHI